MAWFKVDDGLHSSRKIMSIPRNIRLAAVGLWTIAGSWSAQEELDGFVPEFMVTEWGGSQKLVDALVKAGLWDPVDDGSRFRNWGEYQPTRAELSASREKERQRKADWRSRKNGQQTVSHGTDAGQTAEETWDSALSRPVPSRPDPKTDVTHLNPVSTEVDARDEQTDEEFFQVEASKLGIRDLPRVHGALERVVGWIDGAQAIDLARAVLALSKTHVQKAEAYIETACVNSPDQIRELREQVAA